MAKRVTYHVTGERGDWAVKREGSSKPVSTHRSKEAAVDSGRKHAKSEDLGQLKIHKEGGRIQTEHTYGNDPKRSKG